MERFAVHICLVSKQLLPNLLLCCAESTRPERVILLVTVAMRKQGKLLEELIQQQGCQVEIVGVDSYDINLLQKQLSELLSKFSQTSIAMNVTGGNKLMALAAFLETWSCDVAAFYIDTDTDTLWQLGEHSQQSPLPDLLKAKLYLQAYGYRIISAGAKSIPPGLAQLTAELVEDVEHWNSAIKSLNFYASMATNSLYTELNSHDLKKHEFRQLLDKLEQNKLLSVSTTRLIFADEEARTFANGGWLEQHVLGMVQQLKVEGRIRDVVLNGVIEDSSGTKNEIDVLFTARNRLFIIECKTKNMHTEKSRVDEMVYKLESLKGLVGGLYGQAMLLSYFPVPSADRARCTSFGLALVEGRQLKDLRSRLCQWIDAKLPER